MPKNIKNKSKPTASNAGGDANKEKVDTPKINSKPLRDNKPKSDILQHNGTSAPNINSWAAALNNPEVFSKLELTLPWSSSLFKEGLDVSFFSLFASPPALLALGLLLLLIFFGIANSIFFHSEY